MKRLVIVMLLLFTLFACQSDQILPTTTTDPGEASEQVEPGFMQGMGMGSGMMSRHHARLSDEYAGLVNPLPMDAAVLQRGEEIYTAQCASCHGDGGMGDGPAGELLDPPASPIAHTSQMMGDDYLFWRISEGGIPFETAMPAWKDVLDEQSRWSVIHYVRALGQGLVQPKKNVGGVSLDPTIEAAHHAEMLSQAVAQGVLTEAEAKSFDEIHQLLDDYLQQHPEISGSNMDARQLVALSKMVAAGLLTQEQADTFRDLHDRLVQSGVMQD